MKLVSCQEITIIQFWNKMNIECFVFLAIIKNEKILSSLVKKCTRKIEGRGIMKFARKMLIVFMLRGIRVYKVWVIFESFTPITGQELTINSSQTYCFSTLIGIMTKYQGQMIIEAIDLSNWCPSLAYTRMQMFHSYCYKICWLIVAYLWRRHNFW